MAESRNPWRRLRARPEITMHRERLPDALGGGIYLPFDDGTAAVVIDPRLGRRERAFVLAHELDHHDTGGGLAYEGMPEEWRWVVRRDERATDRRAAESLVDRGEVVAWATARAELDPVERWEVGEEFDVADWVADLLMGYGRS